MIKEILNRFNKGSQKFVGKELLLIPPKKRIYFLLTRERLQFSGGMMKELLDEKKFRKNSTKIMELFSGFFYLIL